MNGENSNSNSNGRKIEGAANIKIPVPWGNVSGKWWGPTEVQPILALHGRQDNAGSYDTLMPILAKDLSILCLDLPGHGLSSHLPKGQYYYLHWDGVMLLRRIVRHFRWSKVKLMGHSLGGAISFLYAAMYPDEVEFVISLDIASPCVRSPSKVAEITGDQIDKYLKYETLSMDSQPCYDYEEMIDIVFGAHNGSITRESAEILMKRGMQLSQTRGQYYFSRDSRLKVSLLGAMSMDLALEYAARIKCAYLNIRAIPGLTFEDPDNYSKILDVIKQGSKRFEYHEVEGTHHVHLNNPEKISDILKNFIKG